MASEVARVARRLEDAKETKCLDLSKCELMKIPDACYLMLKETNVEKCDLSGNSIKRIPSKFFSKFPSINEINLQENQLTTLPDEVKDMDHLEKLNLSNNKFESFPSTICDCPRLKSVILKDNKITDVCVEQLQKMSSLVELDVQDNPLSAEAQATLAAANELTVYTGVSDPKGRELDEVE